MKHISNVRGNAMHYVALAALLAASLLPALLPQNVEAAQLTSRSIQLSDSTPSDTATYSVSFTTTQSASSVRVQLCANNPIEGDSCTNTTADTSGASYVAGSGITGGSIDSATNDPDVVVVSGTVANGSVSFDLTGITNPTSAGTFYARISTHSSSDGSGSSLDFGGIALSANDDVTVTAKVHETLSFSVTTLNGADSQIALGDANGVLVDPATVYDSTGDNAEMSIATNAQSGAIVRLSGDTLTDGSNDIDAAGALGAFSGNSSTEEFGLHVDTSGSTNITADTDYDGSGGNYALVNTGGAGTADITQAGGAEIANTAGGPTDTDTAEVEFAAQASNTTPAGIYTGTYTFIATGTF